MMAELKRRRMTPSQTPKDQDNLFASIKFSAIASEEQLGFKTYKRLI